MKGTESDVFLLSYSKRHNQNEHNNLDKRGFIEVKDSAWTSKKLSNAM